MPKLIKIKAVRINMSSPLRGRSLQHLVCAASKSEMGLRNKPECSDAEFSEHWYDVRHEHNQWAHGGSTWQLHQTHENVVKSDNMTT